MDPKKVEEVSKALAGKVDETTGKVHVWCVESKELIEVWPVDAAELIATGAASYDDPKEQERMKKATALATKKAAKK